MVNKLGKLIVSCQAASPMADEIFPLSCTVDVGYVCVAHP